eukprot:gene13288-14596_t
MAIKSFFIVLCMIVMVAVSGKAVSKTPQMGWNSWNKFACNISETLIRETADALVSSGLRDLGYVYLNLDDCWQTAKRNEQSVILADSERFPSGLKSVGEYIHSKDLKFGIYSSAGFKTCQGFPASLGLEAIDAKSYAEWEVDYLKYDNCYQDHGIPTSRYGAMAKALDATGREIFYSLCEWGRENPAVWGASIGANSWRVSGDIKDSWQSIISRAEHSASLWRFAGPDKGWNDPDMLEIGNGRCSTEEYKTHFSLWSILKAPLIIGNDIRTMTVGDEIYNILSNKEVIAVNQDSLGYQGRITWSDVSGDILPSKGYGNRLIATKCSSGKSGVYEDKIEDQKWQYQADGTILSTSTGDCLHELSGIFDAPTTFLQSFNASIGIRSVTTKNCAEATKWDIEQFTGASIVSRSSGLCLEVAKPEFWAIVQGKRVQTAPCQANNHFNVDVREHQSWTAPTGALLNLYQRQCLTVDRDAYPGLHQEVWMAPLTDGYSVLIVNKSLKPVKFSLTLDKAGLPDGRYKLRDLWEHKDLTERLTSKTPATFIIESHASVMLKVTSA